MFKLEIDRGNAAFRDGNDAYELARILRKLADRLEAGDTQCAGTVGLHDYNGNRVGKADWTARPSE